MNQTKADCRPFSNKPKAGAVNTSCASQWRDLIIPVTFNADLRNVMQIPSLSPSDTKAPPRVQLQLTARLGNTATNLGPLDVSLCIRPQNNNRAALFNVCSGEPERVVGGAVHTGWRFVELSLWYFY